MTHYLLLLCLIFNSFFKGLIEAERQHTIGLLLPPKPEDFSRTKYFEKWPIGVPMEIPQSFDSRSRWPKCESLRRIYDQGKCSFCWAIATASALSDRLCIASKGNITFEYSAEDMLACCKTCAKADSTGNLCPSGASYLSVLRYVRKYGAVSGGDINTGRGCKPMSSEVVEKGVSPPCERQCTNKNHNVSYKDDRRYLKGETYIDSSLTPLAQVVKRVQLEIMKNGPVLTAVYIPKSFTDYKDEVCQSFNKSEKVYGHAVKIIGWGSEDGVPYWLCANSWGPDWGQLGGFFKFIRGKNFAKIDATIYAPILGAESGCNRLGSVLSIFCITLLFLYCL